MTTAWFLTFTGPEDQRADIAHWFQENALPPITHQAGVLSVDLFSAEKAHDPHLDDGAGSLLMVQTDLESKTQLEKLLASSGWLAGFASHSDQVPPGCQVFQGVYETVDQVVNGQTEVQPRQAPLSYVVRYYRPAEDEKVFTDFYISHHPQILADLPKIRNVYCYLPLAFDNPTSVEVEDCMLGNEVVFDSLDDLNASLKSDVRHRLREDYMQFPKFSGPNSHYAMLRQRVFES